MVELRADVIVPAPPADAFAALTDLARADWLPSVRTLRHTGGPSAGEGARYEVELGVLGRPVRGELICREAVAPRRAVYEFDRAGGVTIEAGVRRVAGGCSIELVARYSPAHGPVSGALGRAAAGPGRRELARALEQLSAKFGRRQATASLR